MASATASVFAAAPVAARSGASAPRCGVVAAPRAGAAARLSAAQSAAFGQRAALGRVAQRRPAPARVAPAPSAMARFEAERTYIMIKPDGVQRGLVGEIISRFERKGFVLKGLKQFTCPQKLAEEHYKDLSAKPFFKDLVAYIISGPVVAMVWEGPGAVKSARKLIGATNPLEAEPGTIRGDFAVETGRNVIHGSDSVENGAREIKLWFGDDKTPVEWTPTILPWLREL